MVTKPKADAQSLHTDVLQRFQSGDAAGARELLRTAIRLNPNVAAYHANLAVVLKGIGSTEERIALYRRAIVLDPNDPITHANLAAVLSDTGDYPGAEEQARIALAIDPDRAETWLNLGGGAGWPAALA